MTFNEGYKTFQTKLRSLFPDHKLEFFPGQDEFSGALVLFIDDEETFIHFVPQSVGDAIRSGILCWDDVVTDMKEMIEHLLTTRSFRC